MGLKIRDGKVEFSGANNLRLWVGRTNPLNANWAGPRRDTTETDVDSLLKRLLRQLDKKELIRPAFPRGGSNDAKLR